MSIRKRPPIPSALVVLVGVLVSTAAAGQEPVHPPPPPSEEQDAADVSAPAVLTLAPEMLASALAGGVVRLEFDRMTGTAFPTPQTRSGIRHDLPSIYQAGAGVALVVTEDETTIPPLRSFRPGSFGERREYITDAELDALARRHRRLPVAPRSVRCGSPGQPATGTCTEYYVYGIVVDHLYRGKDGTLGVMWDTSRRSQFAMFYQHPIVHGDEGRYLRSVAHEIGHAFNLHHEDGDGHSSIITQTQYVGSDYTYEFSAAEQAHLRNHTPQKCSRPGAGSFTSVDAAHAHSGVVTNCN